MPDRPAPPRPRNLVVVLLDSLNRHMLGAYGGTEFATPNLDRFAASAIRFTNHYAGSLPCMPARHDILCGNLDFLWRPWGSIEVWEEAVTVPLRRAGVVTKLVTDHPHLFETGGENYHVDFSAWAYERGHEGDLWRTRPDPSWAGAPDMGRGHMPYDDSRGWFRDEADFPGPRTMSEAARWLDQEAGADRPWMLFVDEFDPHEPFDTPEPYASLYDPEWQGPHLIWPPYSRRTIENGVLTPEQARQVRAQYGGKLTMIDRWFGRVLDALDRNGFAGDTAVVVCTDHGHYLGEHDLFGKPGAPVYQTLGFIPLLIRWPGAEPGTRSALTTSVDLHATICDVFGVSSSHRTSGASLVPVITGERSSVREWALFGVWGREVHVTDGRTKYVRGPAGESNFPLSMWSNRWSTMPVHGTEVRLPPPDDRAWLDHMPGSTVPVIRQPFAPGDMLPYWALTRFTGHHLFDVAVDPDENEDRAGEAGEKEAADLLREALRAIEAPDDQLERLGLA
ncbi:MAG TPA: sulfatase [Acidimicrobiales bacterium]|nr:sulfatase [Acidimicrobiales bacterium]